LVTAMESFKFQMWLMSKHSAPSRLLRLVYNSKTRLCRAKAVRLYINDNTVCEWIKTLCIHLFFSIGCVFFWRRTLVEGLSNSEEGSGVWSPRMTRTATVVWSRAWLLISSLALFAIVCYQVKRGHWFA
jgi:hypothetical protein